MQHKLKAKPINARLDTLQCPISCTPDVERQEKRVCHPDGISMATTIQGRHGRFIWAVEPVELPHYYRPDEITPEMYTRRIRIIGGQLNDCEDGLITT